MTFWKQLLRVELAAVTCLLVYAAILTGLLRVGAAVLSPAAPETDGLWLSFALILWFGVLPALLLFAPVYALLRAVGFASFPAAVIIGIVSGALFVALVRAGGGALFAIPSSVIVAVGVHAIMRKGSRVSDA